MNYVVWKPEYDEFLCKLIEDGATYREATDAINKKFNTTFTRNSTIGRGSRIGLRHTPAELREKRADGCRKARAAPRKPPQPRKPKAVKLMPKPQVFVCDPMSGLRQADVVPLNLPLLELEQGQCRWPYGDGPFVFCGCEVWQGGPYCEPHTSLAQGRGTYEERDAHRVSRRVAA